MNPDGKKSHGDGPAPNEKLQGDEKLDEAIPDSMVASDPPAAVSKGAPTAPPRRPAKPGEENDKRDEADKFGKL